MDRLCLHCGADISNKSRGAKYCSHRCRNSPRFRGTYCKTCGEPLNVISGRTKATLFCSKECRFLGDNPEFKADFFSIPTIENCYWAGFIAADGCISSPEGRSKRLSFNLARTDKDHLVKFQKSVGAGKIYDTESVSYFLHSDTVCNDLEKVFKITPRKTFTLEPPDLSGDFATAFIAGLIDGDGSYTKNGNRPTLSLVGNKEMLFWVKESLSLENNIFKTGNIYGIAVHGDKAILIRQRFHKLNLPLLERKKNRWEELNLNLNIRRNHDNKFASNTLDIRGSRY